MQQLDMEVTVSQHQLGATQEMKQALNHLEIHQVQLEHGHHIPNQEVTMNQLQPIVQVDQRKEICKQYLPLIAQDHQVLQAHSHIHQAQLLLLAQLHQVLIHILQDQLYLHLVQDHQVHLEHLHTQLELIDKQ